MRIMKTIRIWINFPFLDLFTTGIAISKDDLIIMVFIEFSKE